MVILFQPQETVYLVQLGDVILANSWELLNRICLTTFLRYMFLPPQKHLPALGFYLTWDIGSCSDRSGCWKGYLQSPSARCLLLTHHFGNLAIVVEQSRGYACSLLPALQDPFFSRLTWELLCLSATAFSASNAGVGGSAERRCGERSLDVSFLISWADLN